MRISLNPLALDGRILTLSIDNNFAFHQQLSRKQSCYGLQAVLGHCRVNYFMCASVVALLDRENSD